MAWEPVSPSVLRMVDHLLMVLNQEPHHLLTPDQCGQRALVPLLDSHIPAWALILEPAIAVITQRFFDQYHHQHEICPRRLAEALADVLPVYSTQDSHVTELIIDGHGQGAALLFDPHVLPWIPKQPRFGLLDVAALPMVSPRRLRQQREPMGGRWQPALSVLPDDTIAWFVIRVGNPPGSENQVVAAAAYDDLLAWWMRAWHAQSALWQAMLIEVPGWFLAGRGLMPDLATKWMFGHENQFGARAIWPAQVAPTPAPKVHDANDSSVYEMGSSEPRTPAPGML